MEVNIRFVGGLLSAYAMTGLWCGSISWSYYLSTLLVVGDEGLKKKVVEIANKLLPVFNTQTGIPLASINLHSFDNFLHSFSCILQEPFSGEVKNWGWAHGSILSELGTMQLEFDYLSIVTGNSTYSEKVRRKIEHNVDK